MIVAREVANHRFSADQKSPGGPVYACYLGSLPYGIGE